jgi:ubiquinone/menaquinone biosynthesis C-methylase UbiE
VIAVDIAPRMLEQGRLRAQTDGKTNICFQEAAAEALPFESGTFSLVVSRHAPHHFRAASPEVTRLLEPQFDHNNRVLSFIEPILVARMEP